MEQEKLHERLIEEALGDMPGITREEMVHVSFCVNMVATRADGSAIGGSFIVDPAIPEDLDSETLVKEGSLPSLTSYIMMKQGQPIVNRCITAAVALQTIDTEKDDG
jgi:hypothetical protein